MKRRAGRRFGKRATKLLAGGALLAGALVVALGIALVRWATAPPRADAATPLARGVYVWQEEWGSGGNARREPDGASNVPASASDVEASLALAAPELDRVFIFAGEVVARGANGAGNLTAADARSPGASPTLGVAGRIKGFDPAALRRAAVGRPVTATIRVDDDAAKAILREGASDEAARALDDLIVAVLSRSDRKGRSPFDSLQLDLDAPTAALARYRLVVEKLRALLHSHTDGTGNRQTSCVSPNLGCSITALPDWLRSPDFAPLARAAGRFTLQVHSLEAPDRIDDPIALCDPVAARRWIERAGEAGIPFEVALPTYGYRFVFDAEGRYLAFRAEGSLGPAPAGAATRDAVSDPVALAALVADLARDRPRALEGVVWFRLPVASDRLNWSWETLREVMAGRAPEERLEARVDSPSPGLYEIRVANRSRGYAPGELEATVEFPARPLAYDLMNGYRWNDEKGSARSRIVGPIPRPGEERLAGWFRTARPEDGAPGDGAPRVIGTRAVRDSNEASESESEGMKR